MKVISRGDSDTSPSLTVSILNNARPKAILAIGYNMVSLISFSSGLSTGAVSSVYGTNNVSYDTNTNKLTIAQKNRSVIFLYSDEFILE